MRVPPYFAGGAAYPRAPATEAIAEAGRGLNSVPSGPLDRSVREPPVEPVTSAVSHRGSSREAQDRRSKMSGQRWSARGVALVATLALTASLIALASLSHAIAHSGRDSRMGSASGIA